MNKNIIIGFLVIIIGIGGFLILNQKNTSNLSKEASPTTDLADSKVVNENLSTKNNNTSPVAIPGKATEFTGTYDELMLRGGNQYCTFDNHGKPEIDIPGDKGYFYISNTQANGFIETKPGMIASQSQLHIIRKGKDIYRWFTIKGNESEISNATQQVFDSESPKTNRVKAGLNPDGSQKYWDMPKQVVTFSCKEWKPDQSMFSLPTGVNFEENSELIY